MIRTVRLYGRLKKICGVDSVTLSGSSVAELIEGLSANFREQLKPRINQTRMVCRVKGFDSEQSLFEPLADDVTEIHLYPALAGAGGKNGGLFKVIIGAIIIAVAVVFAPVLGGLAVPLMKFGASLMIGGLMQMLSPVPKVDTNAANDIESSKYLGANQNTTQIGTPVPLLLGRHKVYGHFMNFNVDAKNVAI